MAEITNTFVTAATEEVINKIPGASTVTKMLGMGSSSSGGSKDNGSKHVKSLLKNEMRNVKDLINIKDKLVETTSMCKSLETTINNTTTSMKNEYTTKCNELSSATTQLREQAFTAIESVESSLTDSLNRKSEKLEQGLNLQADTLTRSFSNQLKTESKNLVENLNNIKKASAEALANTTKEMKNHVGEVQKNLKLEIKNVKDDLKNVNSEMRQLLTNGLKSVSQKRLELEEMTKNEIKNVENNVNEYKEDAQKVVDGINDTIEKLQQNIKDINSLYNDVNERINTLTKQCDEINDTISENKQLFQSWDGKYEEMAADFQQKIVEAVEKEASKNQKDYMSLKKQIEETQKKVEQETIARVKEINKNAVSFEKVATKDLPKLQQNLHDVQSEIRKQTNMKKLSENQLENRIVTLEKKLESMNEKYMALLEDNISMRSELHEMEMKQITTPNVMAKNHFYHRQNSECSEIDEIEDDEALHQS